MEYAHGGTEPIARLKTSKALTPQDCSVDPTTGNLAVVGYPQNDVKGRVLVYPRATGLPTTYRVSFATTSYCAYDNQGNLLVDGQGWSEYPPFAAAELQKGAQKFSTISFGGSAPSYQPTPVQWDGTYFAIGTPIGTNQYAISDGVAEQKGSMTIDQYEPYDFWIQGGRIVVTSRFGSPTAAPVAFYKYPAGGSATKVTSFQATFATVSAAK